MQNNGIEINLFGMKYQSLRQFCKLNKINYQKVYPQYKKGITLIDICSKEGIKPIYCDLQINGIYSLKKMKKTTRDIFCMNPYVVTGVSSSSSKVDVMNVIDKFEKLDRLKALSSYKSPFDINYIEKPDRKIEYVRKQLSNIDDLFFRFFWMNQENYDDYEKKELFYFHVSEILNEKLDIFDLFNYKLFMLLVKDPDAYDICHWEDLIVFLSDLLDINESIFYERLVEHVGIQNCSKYNQKTLVNRYRNSLNTLINNCLNELSIQGLINIIEIIKGIDKCRLYPIKRIYDDLDKCIIQIVTREVENDLIIIEDTIDRIKAHGNLAECSFEDALLLDRELTKIKDKTFANIVAVKSYIDDTSFRMLMDKISVKIYDATICIGRRISKNRAAIFDSFIYPFCSKQNRENIIEYYGLKMLKIDGDFLSPKESYDLSNKYEKEELFEQGFMLMKSSAERGYAAAQNDLGVYYALGKYVRSDVYKAIEWYKLAANNGNVTALGNLANNYLGLKKYELAKEFFVKAFICTGENKYKEKLDSNFKDWQNVIYEFFDRMYNATILDKLVEAEMIDAYAKKGIINIRSSNNLV